MGLYNSITKASTRGEVRHYDSHGTITDKVLDGSSDGITPSTDFQWQVNAPTRIATPTTATVEEAEKEELEAIEYGNQVANGVRVMKARAKKVREHVKLVLEHRNYSGVVVKATTTISAANKGLADKIQDARKALAGMGHNLDNKIQTTDHEVEKIKARYNQGRK